MPGHSAERYDIANPGSRIPAIETALKLSGSARTPRQMQYKVPCKVLRLDMISVRENIHPVRTFSLRVMIHRMKR